MRWRARVSCMTPSWIWDSWYFTRFLFRDESLMQVKMASLMVLVTLCTSLPMMEKQATLVGCPVDWLCW